MEQAAVKRKKVIVPFLIGLLLLSSIVFIKHLMNRMNSYIEKNGKMSMGAVVEQMQQTYELQTNGYYSQLQNWLPGIMKKYKTVLIWLRFHVSHIALMEKRIPQLERHIIMQN